MDRRFLVALALSNLPAPASGGGSGGSSFPAQLERGIVVQ